MQILDEFDIRSVNGGTLNGALGAPGLIFHPPGAPYPLPIAPPVVGGPIHTPPLI